MPIWALRDGDTSEASVTTDVGVAASGDYDQQCAKSADFKGFNGMTAMNTGWFKHWEKLLPCSHKNLILAKLSLGRFLNFNFTGGLKNLFQFHPSFDFHFFSRLCVGLLRLQRQPPMLPGKIQRLLHVHYGSDWVHGAVRSFFI